MTNETLYNGPINQAAVFEAANRIALRGKMPSILSVREELGGRGSESTLQKHLKTWKHNLLINATPKPVRCSESPIETLQSQNTTDEELLQELIQITTELEKYKALCKTLQREKPGCRVFPCGHETLHKEIKETLQRMLEDK